MLPSSNKVWRRWKQESFCFKVEALHLWLQKGQLDKIRDKKMPSTGAQNLLGSINILQNRYRTVFETNQIAKADSVEKAH